MEQTKQWMTLNVLCNCASAKEDIPGRCDTSPTNGQPGVVQQNKTEHSILKTTTTACMEVSIADRLQWQQPLLYA
jgi:hypothetical protein